MRRGLIGGAALAASAAIAPLALTRAATATRIRPSASTFPHADAALVLGARVHADGRPSRFLRERIAIGAALVLDGTVSRVIMSGAGRDSSGHGEPAVMRRVAAEMGVPADAIISDPFGVDTYSSCVRAHQVWGATSLIVASQEFHLPRAVWICDHIGVPALGAYPPVRFTKSMVWGHGREMAATAKAWADVARSRTAVLQP